MTRAATMSLPLALAALVLGTGVAEAGPADARNGAAPPTAAAAATASSAVPVRVDGRWTVFLVGGTGTSSQRYSFSSDGPVLVTVADFLCRGDRYRVFDSSVPLGLTSRPAPADGCADYAPTPDDGLADPDFSSGTFAVGAGRHVLRMQIVDSPYGGAASAFRLTPAPTPSGKQDCKRGGWRGLYDRDGEVFRNQGQCVSSVAPR